jgi:gliding motility-associated-like protein
VKIYPKFFTAFKDSGDFCPGIPIYFTDMSTSTIKPITSWKWTFGDGGSSTEANPVHVYPSGGTYNVVLAAENIKNCVDTSFRRIIVQDFKPYAGDDTIIVKGESIQFDGKGGTKYSWTPPDNLTDTGISNPVGFYPDTGTYVYSLFVRSNYGCFGYDTIRVWVVDHASFVVPNAFSPNGDGKNDIFRPRAVGYRNLKYFRVFNRWGEEVYRGKSLEDGWNGTYNNMPAEMGVYFWEISFIDRFGKDGYMKGDVTLLR